MCIIGQYRVPSRWSLTPQNWPWMVQPSGSGLVQRRNDLGGHRWALPSALACAPSCSRSRRDRSPGWDWKAMLYTAYSRPPASTKPAAVTCSQRRKARGPIAVSARSSASPHRPGSSTGLSSPNKPTARPTASRIAEMEERTVLLDRPNRYRVRAATMSPTAPATSGGDRGSALSTPSSSLWIIAPPPAGPARGMGSRPGPGRRIPYQPPGARRRAARVLAPAPGRRPGRDGGRRSP